MNFLKCVFPKEQIFYRAVLGRYFLNGGCLLWNHAKNLFVQKISLRHKGNWKTHLKTKITTYYKTVQHKCVVCSKLIMPQFLRTLEVRKRVDGCVLQPGNSFFFFKSANNNWLYITIPVLSNCFKGCWVHSNS